MRYCIPAFEMHGSGRKFRCLEPCVCFLGFVHLMIGILGDNIGERAGIKRHVPTSDLRRSCRDADDFG